VAIDNAASSVADTGTEEDAGHVDTGSMQEERNVGTDKRGGRVPADIIVPAGDDKFRTKTVGKLVDANGQGAADIKRQVPARIDHPAAAVVEENVNIRVGAEVSANFDVDVSACADVASRVSCFIVVLDVGSETIHLDVAVHCERQIAAVVDLGICVLN